MSKPIQAINRYKADLREFSFLLFEQFQLGELLGKAPFEAWGEDEVKTSLAECYRWVREVIGPLNAVGDARGAGSTAGRCRPRPGSRQAWKSLYEAGWKSIAVDTEYGGAGAPHSLQVLVEELISGANTAFSMYPGLAYGAAEVIESFGTAGAEGALLRADVRRQWGGTMCLTEPHAGSDVGAARTTRDEERGRELLDRRDEDLHLRRGPRPRREHRPPRARARRRGAGGDQGPHALHRSEDPLVAGRHARRDERREGREHRAQDGHQRLGDLRPELRRRRRVHRLARRRRREAQPGHERRCSR